MPSEQMSTEKLRFVRSSVLILPVSGNLPNAFFFFLGGITVSVIFWNETISPFVSFRDKFLFTHHYLVLDLIKFTA